MRFALLIMLFVVVSASAQTVQVIDEFHYKPIADVVISDIAYTKSVKTDMLGMASLAAFNARDSLVFRVYGYPIKTIAFKTLKKDGFKFFMLDDSFMAKVGPATQKRDDPEPSTISKQLILDEAAIEELNASDAASMLEETGSVMVQRSQGGGGSPVIRGFEANRILMVVDGVRMNNAIYRSGHLQNAITVDNNMLSSTDILFGPGSVIFGSDALGGVLHFHTKTPRLLNEKKGTSEFSGFAGNAMTRFNTVNLEKSAHFDFELGGKKWAYLASVSANDFGDLKMGKVRSHGYEDFGKLPYYVARVNGADSAIANTDQNLQVNSGYQQLDVMQKIRYQASKDFNLILNTQLSTSTDIGRFDRLNDLKGGLPKFAEWYYGPQKRFLTSLKGAITNKSGLFNSASFILAYQNIDEDRITRKYKDDWKNYRSEDVDVFSINLDLTKRFDSIQAISYGTEATYNYVKSSSYSQNILTDEKTANSTRYPDGGSYMATFAAYMAYDRKLSEHSMFNSGVRYSRSLLYSTFEDTTFVKLPFDNINFNGGALSGSVGLLIEPDKTSKVNIVASTGFRSPNVDDYGKVFEKDGNVVVPNNQLRPENAYNGEISFTKSFRKRIKTVVSTDQKAELIRVSAGVFYTHLTNTIVRVDYQLDGQDSLLYDGDMAKIQTNSNASNAFIYGGTAEINMHFTPSLYLKSNITYTFGEDLANSTPLGHIPPIYGQTSLNLGGGSWKLSAYSRYNGKKLAVDYAPSGEDNLPEATVDGTPFWFTLNLKGAWTINEHFKLQGSIENILDHHFKQFASGISSPGRAFSLTLRAKF
jgi:hemoglobin/transferrin/lactoferrin receptor protein